MLLVSMCGMSQQTGKATYYAKYMHNHKTASGSRLNNYGYECAHKKHPFGTMLRVRNLNNNKEVRTTHHRLPMMEATSLRSTNGRQEPLPPSRLSMLLVDSTNALRQRKFPTTSGSACRARRIRRTLTSSVMTCATSECSIGTMTTRYISER